MKDRWQRKPGDRVVRRHFARRSRLRRVLDVPALFSAGYGNVGGSIYYALGVVAVVALGATPLALIAAGVVFIFNSLTYAEGGTMIPEAGGSASFTRYAFNDLGGFISGWALMLSYIVTISISAFTIPPYLSYFWPMLKQPVPGTTLAIGVILLFMALNVIGIKESTKVNLLLIIIGIITQVALVITGLVLILIPHPQTLIQNMFGEGNWPSTTNLIFGIAIASLSFTGVETIAQLAEETRRPEKKIPSAYILLVLSVLAIFAGISIVALAAMSPQVLADPVNGWARDPVSGIVANLPSETLRQILAPPVAILAAILMITGTNAGIIGSSRLAFNLSAQRQFPRALNRVHGQFRTPYIAIFAFSFLAILILVPGFFAAGFFADLGALYVFGSLLCFALAHASILGLRVRNPDLPRPFKLGWNIKIMKRELPIPAILGLLTTSAIWLIVVLTQPFSRLTGLAWMVGGLVMYYFYRRRAHLPLTYTPTIETDIES